MNNPSPLLPQGSLQSNRGNPNVRIAVFVIIAIHAVFFTGILMQGCKRESNPPVTAVDNQPPRNELPTFDRSYYESFQEMPKAVPESPQLSTPLRTPTPPPTVGQLSSLPPAPLPPSSPAPGALTFAPTQPATEYQVARGDTIWKIATAHNLTVPDLTRANPGIDPASLRPGQKLQIPPRSATVISPAIPAIGAAPAGTNGRIHEVKAGDNLTKIARQYGITVPALKAANNMTTDRINVGQKLRLPATNGAAGGAPSQSETQTGSGSGWSTGAR
jgi:LysM repeat protein